MGRDYNVVVVDETKIHLFYSQMHGYDMGVMNMAHGPPIPPTMEPNTHHPDSTDSYVTYLESDDSMQGSP